MYQNILWKVTGVPGESQRVFIDRFPTKVKSHESEVPFFNLLNFFYKDKLQK